MKKYYIWITGTWTYFRYCHIRLKNCISIIFLNRSCLSNLGIWEVTNLQRMSCTFIKIFTTWFWRNTDENFIMKCSGEILQKASGGGPIVKSCVLADEKIPESDSATHFDTNCMICTHWRQDWAGDLIRLHFLASHYAWNVLISSQYHESLNHKKYY